MAGILYSCHITALDPFCCHYIRHSYHSGFTVLQLCPVLHSSLKEDAISEIVVADSDWELGAEGSNVEHYLEEEEE